MESREGFSIETKKELQFREKSPIGGFFLRQPGAKAGLPVIFACTSSRKLLHQITCLFSRLHRPKSLSAARYACVF